MTLWIILGAIGLVLVLVCLVALALCVAASIGDDLAEHAHRGEHICSAPLYSTADRGADPRVVRLMHTGMHADEAVRRAMGETR